MGLPPPSEILNTPLHMTCTKALCQIPRLFHTFQVNIYGVSTLATVAIQNEMHVISHCNTHIYCHNYNNCVLQ